MEPDESTKAGAVSPPQRTQSQRLAQAFVLVALVGAMVVGWAESREKSASDIPLKRLARQVGSWKTVDEVIQLSDNAHYKLLERTLENDKEETAHVTIQATYTRLGSLRDWDLAGMAGGWSVTESSTWKDAQNPGELELEARIQEAERGNRRIVTLSWYTSAVSQAPTLQMAEVEGWRERLAGGRSPWASLRVVAQSNSGGDAEQAVKDIARVLGPQIRNLMQQLKGAEGAGK